MKLNFSNTTEKYEWLVKNWHTMSNHEIADVLGTTTQTVGQMAARARRAGVKLVKKNSKKWPGYSNNKGGVDWKKVGGNNSQ